MVAMMYLELMGFREEAAGPLPTAAAAALPSR